MKKYLKYIIAFLVPIMIFFIASMMNGYYPTGKSLFNVYDSISQYPGFYEQLKNFSFFNFTGGLGFNFYSSALYYLMSPLNLLSIFFNNTQFHIFYALIIYLKIGLSGIFMCLFLSKQKKKNDFWAVAFGIAYALSGFITCYYYNTMWMDAVYMLPLVLLGINKLVLENKKTLYLVALTLTILFNYYIGYMICIFSVIYFIYILLSNENINIKFSIRDFIICSILAGVICSIIILPAYFGLMQGKYTGFSDGYTNYFKIHENVKYFFYNLTPGAFQFNDHQFGPAVTYSSLLAVILVVLFFFNKSFPNKHKIVVGAIILFYYLSFFWSGLDYAWQFFQRPVWWQSRYSFTFSAFLILIAYQSICNIEKLKLNMKKKVLLTIMLFIPIIISFICSYLDNSYYRVINIIFFTFSLFIILDYFLLIDKKKFQAFVIILLCVELFINSFVNLKRNDQTKNVDFEIITKEGRNNAVNLVKKFDYTFYRLEFTDSYSSNDGMLFNYNGVNYFNSVRNQRFVNFADNIIGLAVSSSCGVKFNNYNPYLLSLFNIKYIITFEQDYYEKIIENHNLSIFENNYPLSIGFLVDSKVLDAKFQRKNISHNINEIFSTMLDRELVSNRNIQGTVELDSDYFFIYDFKKPTMNVNGQEYSLNGLFTPLNKGDVIQTPEMLMLVDQHIYEEVMQELSLNTLILEESSDLLKGKINVSEDNKLLFLSIPYDKGFNITVDGKETEKLIIFDTFVGVALDKGEHEIIINYVPEGFKVGAVVSLGGILLSIVYLYLTRKPKRV